MLLLVFVISMMCRTDHDILLVFLYSCLLVWCLFVCVCVERGDHGIYASSIDFRAIHDDGEAFVPCWFFCWLHAPLLWSWWSIKCGSIFSINFWIHETCMGPILLRIGEPTTSNKDAMLQACYKAWQKLSETEHSSNFFFKLTQLTN